MPESAKGARRGDIATAVLAACVSFAAAWAALSGLSGCSSGPEGPSIDIGPRVEPWPWNPYPGHSLALAPLGEGGQVAVLHGCPGAETLAIYQADPAGDLRLLAVRRIHWDLLAYDFTTHGKKVPVQDIQRAIEMSYRDAERGGRPPKEAMRRMIDEEARARAASEAEDRRLFPPAEPK